MPPTQWSYDETIKDAPFDPAKARELLKKAGVAEGTEITLWAMPVQRPYNPNAKLMAEMIQADWAKIGIKARIVSYEWGEYIKRAHAGEHDAMLFGWTGDNGDPDNFLTPQFSCASVKSGLNFARYCDPGLDKLIADGKAASSQEQRTGLYHQAQKLIHEQALWLPLAHPTAFALTRQEVQGLPGQSVRRQDFSRVAVKR